MSGPLVTCRVCGRRLPVSEMVKDSHAALGCKRICKACYAYERKGYPSYIKRIKGGGYVEPR